MSLPPSPHNLGLFAVSQELLKMFTYHVTPHFESHNTVILIWQSIVRQSLQFDKNSGQDNIEIFRVCKYFDSMDMELNAVKKY